MTSQDETPTAGRPEPAAPDPEPTPDPATGDPESTARAEPVPARSDPAEPVSAAPIAAAPDPVLLDRIAAPAMLRRAPRYGAFVRTGALAGVAVGWLLALFFPFAPDAPGAGVIAVTALALGCVGALLGAALAVLAERRG